MAAWIKMALGMEVDLSLGDFVLDGDPASPPLKGHSPPNFRDWSTRGCHRRLCLLSFPFWRHLRVVQSATCPVRESTSPRVGNPRVGVSASCPVQLGLPERPYSRLTRYLVQDIAKTTINDAQL